LAMGIANKSHSRNDGLATVIPAFLPKCRKFATANSPMAKKGVQGEKAQRFSSCCKGLGKGKLTRPHARRVAGRNIPPPEGSLRRQDICPARTVSSSANWN
jgi:hypothetical protein